MVQDSAVRIWGGNGLKSLQNKTIFWNEVLEDRENVNLLLSPVDMIQRNRINHAMVLFPA